MRDPAYDVECPECEGTGRLTCEDCDGTGRGETCHECAGDGTFAVSVEVDKPDAPSGTWTDTETFVEDCEACDGTGNLPCVECEGDGWLTCGTCDGEREVSRESCREYNDDMQADAKYDAWKDDR